MPVLTISYLCEQEQKHVLNSIECDSSHKMQRREGQHMTTTASNVFATGGQQIDLREIHLEEATSLCPDNAC
jgi:hypothetical protein